MSRQQLFNLNS